MLHGIRRVAISVLILTAITAVVLGSNTQRVTLTYMVPGDAARAAIIRQNIQLFEDKNPDIKIKAEIIPYQSFNAKLLAAISSGNPPDIAHVYPIWFPILVAQDVLTPLDSWVLSWEYKDDVFPAAWEFVTWDSHIYGLPTILQIDWMYYRADWFEEEGISPPNNWDEFVAIAKHFTRDDRWGFGFTGATGAAGKYSMAMIMGGGGRWVDEEGNAALDTPGGIKGFAKYIDLFRVDRVCPDSSPGNGFKENLALFAAGKIAMFFHNPGSLVQVRNAVGENAVGTWPIITLAGPTSNFGVDGEVIFKGCKSLEQAWKFIRFLASPETQKRFYQGSGVLPTINQVYDEPPLKDDPAISTVSIIMNGFLFPEVPLIPANWQLLKTEPPSIVQEALLGKISAEEAVKKINAVLAKILAQAKK